MPPYSFLRACAAWLSLAGITAHAVVSASGGERRAAQFLLNRYERALCLDGSPALYYYSAGSGSGSSSWFIFHEGGGFCTSHEDCYARSLTEQGSSRYEAGTHLEVSGLSLFSRTQRLNPAMFNWNFVYVRYCDGAYMSGEVPEPVRVPRYNSTVHYKGRWITEALIEDLASNAKLRQSLSDAERVVFSGCSSGGIRTIVHLDRLRDLVRAHVREPERLVVVGLPDSGYYLNTDIYRTPKKFVIEGQHASGLLSRECLAREAGASVGEEICLVSSVAAPYMKTPIFVYQSRYDTDQRECEMVPSCADDPECVNEYGQRFTQLFQDLLDDSAGKRAGFLDSCSRHCSSGVPRERGRRFGLTPLQLFARWLESEFDRSLSDNQGNASYPCTTCCTKTAGLASGRLRGIRAIAAPAS